MALLGRFFYNSIQPRDIRIDDKSFPGSVIYRTPGNVNFQQEFSLLFLEWEKNCLSDAIFTPWPSSLVLFVREWQGSGWVRDGGSGGVAETKCFDISTFCIWSRLKMTCMPYIPSQSSFLLLLLLPQFLPAISHNHPFFMERVDSLTTDNFIGVFKDFLSRRLKTSTCAILAYDSKCIWKQVQPRTIECAGGKTTACPMRCTVHRRNYS